SPFMGGQDHTSHRLVHLGLPVRAAVGVVYGTAALLAGIGVLLGQASSSVHIAGIVVLAIAGIVALAMLALVPVYGDQSSRVAMTWLARRPRESKRGSAIRLPGWTRTVLARLPRAALCAVFLAVAAASLARLWFNTNLPLVDDLNQFSAIYEWIHRHSLAMPVYPHYPGSRAIVTRLPATHYFIVASLMELTHLPVEAAAILPVITWVALGLLAVLAARWSLPLRIGAALGIYGGLVLWPIPSYIRPDIDMAGAWITGLLALESGRSRDWDPRLLALGSFALTMASALHWGAILAFLGVFVYVAYLFAARSLSRSKRRQALAALLLPGAVVGVPYLAFYILPNAHDILANLTSGNGGFDPLSAIRAHVAAYHYFFRTREGGSVLAALTSPFSATGIPVVTLTTSFLAARRETRAMALASLPVLLFLLFVDQLRVGLGILYLTGEITLYLICAFSGLIFAFNVVAKQAGHRSARLRSMTHSLDSSGRALRWRDLGASLAGVVLAAALVSSSPTQPWQQVDDHLSFDASHAQMEVARAAGVHIVGSGATETSPDTTTWYTSGASTWYTPYHDPLAAGRAGAAEIRLLDVTRYVASFRALPEGIVGTWIGRLYAAGTLHLTGFFLVANSDFTNLPYFLYSAHRKTVKGFVLVHGRVLELRQNPAGHQELASLHCPNSSAQTLLDSGTAPPSLAGLVTFLPPPNGPQGFGAAAGGSSLVDLLGTRQEVQRAIRLPALQSCSVRSLFALATSGYTTGPTLISSARRITRGRIVSFPRMVPAVDFLYAPSAPVSTTVSYGLDEHSTHRKTASGSYLVAHAIPGPLPATRRWVRLAGRLESGTVKLCILDTATRECIASRLVDHSVPSPWYLPVPRARSPLEFVVTRSSNVHVEATFNSLSVLVAR
ncbi:MAG: hypothetical protein M0035_07350, partial [Actinomycetota bacterium]|nr:hypothetical protein [Actinomycetota bacterium]